MNNNQRINQLLMQTRGLSSTNLEGTALIERLRKEAFALAAWSCREIDRITAERDEARRMYCEEAFCHRFNERGGEGTITDPRQIAHSMGWDCFKEDTDG
jgi:hypothetical protein